jgi:electron transport complex protein RnfB
MINAILIPVVILGVMGLIFGAGLAVAAKKFEVKQDERIPLVRAELPGANCGGCGYPGCDAMAEAIVKGEAPANGCPVGGAKVAEAVGKILGEEVSEEEPKVASVLCSGDCDHAPRRAEYYGLKDCNEAVIANGGPKDCRFGCIGLGSCVTACMFDALSMGEKGLPVVNIENCTACGKCAATCPKSIIDLIPKSQVIHVNCQSKEKGKIVRSSCSVGCIGCKACTKVCPEEAITVTDNLAKIDYEKCVQCGACVEKCPTGAIVKEIR